MSQFGAQDFRAFPVRLWRPSAGGCCLGVNPESDGMRPLSGRAAFQAAGRGARDELPWHPTRKGDERGFDL